jgi:hypothetical protein
MILQRRLTSSSHAIYESLKRRKTRLKALLTLAKKIRQDEDIFAAGFIIPEEKWRQRTDAL